ncbi:MAG: EF-hand domain-containing protein [Hyphomicrobiaceae bacterium]
METPSNTGQSRFASKRLVLASTVAIGAMLAGLGFVAAQDGRGGPPWARGHGGPMSERGAMRLDRETFQERVRARFAELDANSDNVISQDEIRAQLERRMPGRRGAHDGDDGDRDDAAENRGEGRGPGRREGRGMGRDGRQDQRRPMAMIDADRDGTVTRDEWRQAAQERFRQLDLDRDGVITEADMPPNLRGLGLLSGDGAAGGRRGQRGAGAMWARVASADADGDGRVTESEFLAASEQRFARFDRNGDGVVDQADREALRADMLDYRIKRFLHRFEAGEAAEISRDAFFARADRAFERLDIEGDGVIRGPRARAALRFAELGGDPARRWGRSRWSQGRRGDDAGHRPGHRQGYGHGHHRHHHGGNGGWR